MRLLGANAARAFAPPGAPGVGALVRLPPGLRGADLGLSEIAPGIGRLWGPPERIAAFADAHPGLPVEIAPPLHPLLDTVAGYVAADVAIQSGMDGAGVLVGLADTGLDVTHPDFLDAQGHSRVAWLLDLSSPPLGLHPDLEQRFGSTDASGKLVQGAVWSAQDIDAVLASGDKGSLPRDEAGHGTLVTSCAAGNGLGGRSAYRGVAPAAGIMLARITDSSSSEIGNDELLRGVAFLFDRADAMGQPVVVNLSIGTDFGPHDGTMAWEQTLASYVGRGHPGRAIVAAAGNSGSIADTPVHQSVKVSSRSPMRVPIIARKGSQQGGVQVWVAMHAGAGLSVGLDGPDETWIAPVDAGNAAGHDGGGSTASVYNGGLAAGSPVPSQSLGAVVVWQGAWAAGTYAVTLSGSGTADLYLQGTGDAEGAVGFADSVRETTVNLPATHPAIIGVGCTVNKKNWRSIDGVPVSLSVPLLDATGAAVDPSGATRGALDGEPCWFSSAGPSLTGVPKPEIMAPGAAVVGALSAQAVPPSSSSIFTNCSCPTSTPASPSNACPQPDCQQIDAEHAVEFGTSLSSPIVAGAVAVLLQHDPTLTQDQILAALQGGAHRLRAASGQGFDDQAGAGEVDVVGAVDAVDRLQSPRSALPVRAESWMTLGADQILADGSTPLQAVVQLRAAREGGAAPPPADAFGDGRLAVVARIDGGPSAPPVTSLERRGPGVWIATVRVPAGLGGSRLTLGITFDGADIVDPKAIPIATDAWNAAYVPGVTGGCALAAPAPTAPAPAGAAALGVLAVVATLRAGRRVTRQPPSAATRAAPTRPAPDRTGAGRCRR
jgi:subtilisin family serine protease